jgi:hypothetical protein
MAQTEEPYVLCGDCKYCNPDMYDGDDECGEECHPGNVCEDKHNFGEMS